MADIERALMVAAPMKLLRTQGEMVDRYELYRVVTDYEGLQDGFADRIEDLNTTLTEVDAAGELTRGNMQRLLGRTDADAWRPKSKRKQSRQFGWETLGKALRGTGMALVLVIDDERFAPVKEQMAKRKRPLHAIARNTRPTWLFSKDRAREMGTKRWAGVSPAKRKRLARKAAKARWRKRQADGALLGA